MCCTAGTCSTWAVTSRWVSEEQAFSASLRSFISPSVGNITPRQHRKQIAPNQQPLLMAGRSRSAVCCLSAVYHNPNRYTTNNSSEFELEEAVYTRGHPECDLLCDIIEHTPTSTGQAQEQGRARWCTASWEVNTSTVAPSHSSSAQNGCGRTLI